MRRCSSLDSHDAQPVGVSFVTTTSPLLLAQRRLQADRDLAGRRRTSSFRLAAQQFDAGAGRIHPEQQRVAGQRGDRLVEVEFVAHAAAVMVR